jgi:hypothetical protein
MHGFQLKVGMLGLYGPYVIGHKTFPNYTEYETEVASDHPSLDLLVMDEYPTVNKHTIFCYLSLTCRVVIEGFGLTRIKNGLAIIHKDFDCATSRNNIFQLSTDV